MARCVKRSPSGKGVLSRPRGSFQILRAEFPTTDCVMDVSRLSKRPAFVAAFADAKEFVKQVPKDKPLIRRFTG